jgi:MFS family permease
MSDPDSDLLDRKHRLVIFASALGTVFEWYDFYIYATLAVFFGKLFFPPGNDTAAYLSSLAAVGVGFSVRPFGALVFGRIGDLVGRKYTFLITIVVMGLSTALIGVLPTYAHIGFWAPSILFLLRLTQGLALGGEYGGAATYVAEHAPHGRRGAFTSWIQTTATVGLFLSLAVILGVRKSMTPDDFASWGWRIPFAVSVLLLAVSVYIRLKLEESPVYAEMKAEGRGSKAPLTESFGQWRNARFVLSALFGATAGQGVIWYAGQFYALYFLTATLKVDYVTAYLLIAAALVVGTPFFVLFGRLSDRVGRKPIMLAGMLLTVLTYQPIFHGLTRCANPALAEAAERSPVTLRTADYRGGAALAFQALGDAFVKIVKPMKRDSPADQARAYLNGKGIPFTVAQAPAEAPLALEVNGRVVLGFSAKSYDEALANSGYGKMVDPATHFADTGRIAWLPLVGLLSVLVLYVTMVYGPIAAFLVELFPTRIRYTSMSLPYHIGNGWFGGFLPLIAASIAVFTGNIYAGLWYPIAVAAFSFVVGLVVLPETKDRDISTHDHAP